MWIMKNKILIIFILLFWLFSCWINNIEKDINKVKKNQNSISEEEKVNKF